MTLTDTELGGMSPEHHVLHSDALCALREFPDSIADAFITDPPYPLARRDYGIWSVEEWRSMVDPIVVEIRRILKPTGSAVLILQPSSERIGRISPWLFDFVSHWAKEWNLIQDIYWWNPASLPTAHTQARFGLCRPSVKMCVWLGSPDCYRNQREVRWIESDSMKAAKLSKRALAGRQIHPSGFSVDVAKFNDADGTSSPFNLIPVANTNSRSSAGASGYGAGTPLDLCDWWVRYLTKPGDLIVDPFFGSGTVGVASLRLGRHIIGIEKFDSYIPIATSRLVLVEQPVPRKRKAKRK